MKRLVTFGCSYTYGHGLSDCYAPPDGAGKFPSSYSWPNVVANELGCPVSNNSVCGNSNFGILHDILNFNFLDGDVVVTMWTFVLRDILFGKKNLLGNQKITHIGDWDKQEIVKHWLIPETVPNMATRAWLNIHHANLYLKSKNIPFYNITCSWEELKKYKPSFIDIDFNKLKTDMHHEPVDLALDNKHPGTKTHKLVADEVLKIIKNGNSRS